MRPLRPVDRDWISFWVGISGTFLSLAGIIANYIGNQTNIAFWGAAAVGGVVFILALLMRLYDGVFRAIMRPFLGQNIISIEPCPDHYVEAVYSLACNYFGDAVTGTDLIRAITGRYRDGLQIAKVMNNRNKPYVAGYYFYFPIQKSCVDRIIDYSFQVSDLRPDEIADRPDRGYAMYIGAIAANGIQVRSELMGALKMKIDLAKKTRSGMAYARAATPSGKRVLEDNGFEPVHPHAADVDCFFQRAFPKEQNAAQFPINYGIVSATTSKDEQRQQRRRQRVMPKRSQYSKR